MKLIYWVALIAFGFWSCTQNQAPAGESLWDRGDELNGNQGPENLESTYGDTIIDSLLETKFGDSIQQVDKYKQYFQMNMKRGK
jgi:hypothetical protein